LSFQYSNKVSSPGTAAPTSAVIAKPQDSAVLKTKTVLTASTKLQPEITATSDTLAPQFLTKHKVVSEDKQWHELRTDYSKLTQYYLMLSKIRLTCTYCNW
jgi:hypothetical protein